MDQIIGEQEAGRHIADRITVRTAAIRRNPPHVGTGRFPCMADIERVEINLIGAADREEGYCPEGFDRNLMSDVFSYQYQMQIPLCFVESGQDDFRKKSIGTDFRSLGFQYVYDRPHYELNTERITEEMLGRAAAGEVICLDAPNVTLQAVGQEDMLALAHFVNARLCRRYGLFTVRSAAYYEEVQKKLQHSGGNLFQVMENGIRKGYFSCTSARNDSIREVVFDEAFDRENCILTVQDRQPAVMARIVNMPAMLKHISGNGKITMAIRIKDPVIADNDGLFIWYIDGEGSHMERVEQYGDEDRDDSSMRPEVTTTIGEFTAFLLGYTKLKENAKFDSIYMAGPVFMNEIY